MNERVAIVGLGWAGFRPVTPDQSYKELMYEAAVRAYADAGVDPRRDVESFVTVAEDFHEGTSIFDEYVPDQLGAVLKPVHTITGDGLHGLATAYMLVRTGQFEVVAVEGHSKASNMLSRLLESEPVMETRGRTSAIGSCALSNLWPRATDQLRLPCTVLISPLWAK